MSESLESKDREVSTQDLDNLAWQDPAFHADEVERAVDTDLPLADEGFLEGGAGASGVEEIDTSIETARTAKQIGNELFLRGQYEEAIHQYTPAIEYCPTDEAFQVSLCPL